jgi:hypothetical protein
MLIIIENFNSCNFKKNIYKFFIQMNIIVLKEYILLKKYFHLKNDKNSV